MAQRERRRPGRRPGPSNTRQAILAAARSQFAASGYDRTTIRSVAEDAGVDPALVLHFFGSKQRLFVSVVELPLDPGALRELVAGPPDGVGERVARFAVTVFEDEDALARWTAMIRSATSEPAAAQLLREILTERVFVPLAQTLGVRDARLRAGLVGSQLVGLVMARHIVGIEPLASLSVDRVAQAIAPTLQRYLTEPL